MAQTFNAGTWEAEASGSPPAQPEEHSEAVSLKQNEQTKHPVFIYNISTISKKKTFFVWQHKLIKFRMKTTAKKIPDGLLLLKPLFFVLFWL